MKNYNILIPGAGGFAAVNAIKSLKMSGFEGKIITSDSNPLSVGFYLADVYYVLPKSDDANFIEKSIEVIKKENIEIILPTSGFDIIQYSLHKKDLKELGVTCFFSDYNEIEICNNKFEFYKKIKFDFPIPGYSISINEHIDYPIFIKPIIGKGSRNTFICRNEEELEYINSNYSNMLYCEFLPGKEYTIDVLSDMSGRAICAIPRERIETKAGISFKGKVVNNSYMKKICMDLANYIGLKGPTCMQMKEDVNGVLKFIEVNPRLGGGTIMASLAGVNIPALILKLYSKESILEEDFEFNEITVLRHYEEIVIRN